MAKGSGRPTQSRGINSKASSSRNNGRAKPMTPKAGFTATRRRYGEGGRIK